MAFLTQENINKLQRQLIVHSFIYYRHGQSLWSDEQWDSAAYTLVSLKDTKEFKDSVFYETFKDFDGDTGFQLLSESTEISPIYWDNLATQLLSY